MSTLTPTAVRTGLDTRTGSAPADPRYADLRDRHLAATLSMEDQAELTDGLDPLERTTCWTHRRWLHQCVSSPLHVIQVTGHRWCRDCTSAVSVAVDELAGDVALHCPRCHRTPDTRATRQIVRACRASLAACAEGRANPSGSLLIDEMLSDAR
jgi:hypothetical protein